MDSHNELVTVTIKGKARVFATKHFRDGEWHWHCDVLECTGGEKIQVDPIVAESLGRSGKVQKKGKAHDAGASASAAAAAESAGEDEDSTIPTEPPEVTDKSDAATIVQNTGGKMLPLEEVTDELRALWTDKDHPQYLTIQPTHLKKNPKLIGYEKFDEIASRFKNRCYVVLTADYCAVLPNVKSLEAIIGKR